MSEKLKRVLFLPDTHVPYHDERAFQLVLDMAKEVKFDRVVILGDFGDFYAVSSHDKNPNRRNSLMWEVEAVNDALDRIDRLKIPEKTFIEGNHENRLERYLIKRAPELFDSVKVRDLFRLDQRGWGFTPYKKHNMVGEIAVTHDTGQAGSTAHVRAMTRFKGNAVIGHTHRMGVHYMGNILGKTHVGGMFGWLGDRTQIDYMHDVNMDDWQLGFGVGLMRRNGTVFLHANPIIDYTCEVLGDIYESQKYTKSKGEYLYRLAA